MTLFFALTTLTGIISIASASPSPNAKTPPDPWDTNTPCLPIKILVSNRTCCQGPFIAFDAIYTAKQPLQIHSYHLSRDLDELEALDFWDALPQGGPIDQAFSGNEIACRFSVTSASPSMKTAGCTNLDAPMGCMRVYRETTTSYPPTLQTLNAGEC